MSMPTPPVAISDPCSVVYNNTLYVYTPNAFQSIALAENATWNQLPFDDAVAGAVCVLATPNGDSSQAALYLVGGSTNVTTTYSGLSQYSFAQNKWSQVSPAVQVTQNRKNHGAAFINATSAIVIYAGSQDSSQNTVPSSQTFLISTNPPFSVISYSSQALPAVSPTVLPWNATHAVMLGGNSNNKRVFAFSKQSGWADLGVQLNTTVQGDVKATIINGDDGSKVLETFDMSQSPNVVSNVVLFDPNSNEMPVGSTLSGSAPSTSSTRSEAISPIGRRKRDLGLSHWPTYNSSLAPNTTRTNYALAQGSNNQVVAVGGNNNDPLSIFNAQQNSWVNATELFLGANAQSTPSSTPSPKPSPSTSPSPSTPSAAPATNNTRSKALTVLGATLGAIFGLALLLGLILLCLRWKRQRSRRNDIPRRPDGSPGNEKDRLSFADRGASFMNDAGGYVRHGQSESMTSMGIMGGKFGKTRHTTGYLGQDDVSRPHGSLDQGGILFPAVPGGPARDGAGKQRSSGWSRYFSGNNHIDLAHASSSRSAKTAGTLSSHFADTDPPVLHHPPRESATPPAHELERSESTRQLTRPNASALRPPGTGSSGGPGQLGREYSSSTDSSGARDDAFSSGIPQSIHEDSQWTPVARQDWADKRTPSSVYTASHHGSMIPREANAGPNFPRNSSHGSILGSMHPQNRSNVESILRESNSRDRESHNTIMAFPRPGTGLPPAHENLEPAPSDMSWLNLGSSRDESHE